MRSLQVEAAFEYSESISDCLPPLQGVRPTQKVVFHLFLANFFNCYIFDVFDLFSKPELDWLSAISLLPLSLNRLDYPVETRG